MKNRVYKKLGILLITLAFASIITGVTGVSGQAGSLEDQSLAAGAPANISSLTSLANTGFTYQGELQDAGLPANGTYDFSFRLLNGPDIATAAQVGSTVAVADVAVAKGKFTVVLDFGAVPFDGSARWLEISVARNGNALTVLSPAQPLTAVPYALYGEDADANPKNELNTGISFTGTTLQITDASGTLSQDLGTFNGNLIIATNGRLGVREPAPITDLQITQSDGLIGGTGGLTFSRSTNWKILHTGSHLSFVESNVRRSYIETGTGNYVTISDAAMKHNIAPMGSVLDRVLQLKPVSYQYLTQSDAAAKSNGFIAQEVGKVFPELVRTAEDGTLGLAYADFGVLAVAAIQEQQTQIDALKQENAALRAEIDEIHAILARGNGSAAGEATPKFQNTAFSFAGAVPGSSPTGSWFSVSNLMLGVLSAIVIGLLWKRQPRDLHR